MPEPLALERIGREAAPAGGPTAPRSRPSRRGTPAHVQRGDGPMELARLVALPRPTPRTGRRRRRRRPGHRRQRRRRAHLQEGAVAEGEGVTDRLLEAHRAADVVAPVGRAVSRPGVATGAGAVADQLDLGFVRGRRRPRRARTRRASGPSAASGRRATRRAARRRSRRPPARPTTASSASAGPRSRRLRGPLTAAIDRVAPAGAMARSTAPRSANDGRHATVAAAAPASAGRGRRRAAARRRGDITPATCAAASSPTLWPSTAAGSTPQLRHSVGQRAPRRRTGPAACSACRGSDGPPAVAART